MSDEYGRTTRAYASGYNITRVSQQRVPRLAKRSVVADFNGAIPPGKTITSVMWQVTAPWSVFMENPQILPDGRSVSVDCTFNYSGISGLQARVFLSDGDIYSYNYRFTILDQPLYPSDTYLPGAGPYMVTSP